MRHGKCGYRAGLKATKGKQHKRLKPSISIDSGLAKSYFYILKAESQKAKRPLRLLLQLTDVSEDSRLAAYSLLSQIYMGLNEYQKAFSHLFDGLSITPKIEDKSLQFNSYYAAANVFVELEAYDEALEYVHKANEIAVAMNDNRNQCYAKALVASVFLSHVLAKF